jgi:hypothetical protein|tara:strand:+ start:190 stop:819 length:630 start_codon:yes stop_codon:yes gene_type:complete
MKNIVLLLLAVLTIGNISYAGFPVTERKVTIFIDSKCDNIILKDGSEISAKIVEITPDLIKYRKCNNLDGPLFSINTNDVLLIRYLDGTKEVFKVNNNSEKNNNSGMSIIVNNANESSNQNVATAQVDNSNFNIRDSNGYGSYGTASLVLGILGLIAPSLIVFSLLATIFGVIGKKRKQKLSKAGLVLGIIGLAIVVVALLFLGSMLIY